LQKHIIIIISSKIISSHQNMAEKKIAPLGLKQQSHTHSLFFFLNKCGHRDVLLKH
jgi:hypothetical protein